MSWAEKWWLPVLVVSIILLILSSIFIEVNNVSTTPVWAWIVGGIAIAILIVAVVFYMISLSKKGTEEFEDDDLMERDKIIEETRVRVVSPQGEVKSEEFLSRKIKPAPRQRMWNENECGVRQQMPRKDCGVNPYNRPQMKSQQMRQQKTNSEAFDEEMQPRLRINRGSDE